MRVLWISFLLIESITCIPQSGSYQGPYFSSGSQSAGQSGPDSPGYSSFSSSSFQPSGGAGSFSSWSPDDQSGSPGSHHQYAQGSWSSSSEDGDKEPVFTPVSSEDQVFAHKSRSQYRKSNLRFHQFVYIPTEPVAPQEPTFPHHKGQVHKGF